jgi:hypothetical protein
MHRLLFKSLLISLLLVLLQLQLGIVTLHHHHNDSWYDNSDPVHYFGCDHPTICKSVKTGGTSLQAAPAPLLPVTPAQLPAAKATPCGEPTATPYSAPLYRVTQSAFLKRAPPA